MQSQNHEQKSWWSTLPGMITAFAGIITAITGLILALNQAGFFNRASEKNKEPFNIPTQSSKINEPGKTASAHEAKSNTLSNVENIEVKFSMNSIKVNTDYEYKILESVVEPKDPQNSFLKIKIRCLNNGRYDLNFWDASFRLAIDDLPTAPVSNLNELVAGHSIRMDL